MRRTHLVALGILALCFLAYFAILDNSFVWDDNRFIQNSPETRTFGRAVESFGDDVFQIYRPLRSFAYFGAYKLFGLTPWAYHLFSIFLHAGVCILIYLIIRTLFGETLALITALLFAIHPNNVGRVANATGSFDLIGILFYLSSFLMYLKFRQRANAESENSEPKETPSKKHLFISIGLFIMGLFASEEIYTLPLLILLYECVFHERRWKNFQFASLYFVFLGAFLFLRMGILGIGARISTYPGGSLFVTVLTMPKVLLQYLLLIFYPLQLTPFRKTLFVETPLAASFLVPLVILLGLAFLVWKFQKSKPALFFAGWLAITLLPFLNLSPLPEIMAERYFYLPSVAIFFLISVVIASFKRRWLFLGALLLILVPLTWWQGNYWQNDFTLMSRGVELNPESPQALNNLGNWYFNFKQYGKAHEFYIASAKADPDYYRAWVNLGALYSATGNYNKSIFAIQQALRLTPGNYPAYDKLGITYMRMNDTTKAEEMFQTSIRLQPTYYRAYLDLGTLYGNMGEYQKAEVALKKAIELNPTASDAYFNLGAVYRNTGQAAKAQENFKKAYSINPLPEYKAAIN